MVPSCCYLISWTAVWGFSCEVWTYWIAYYCSSIVFVRLLCCAMVKYSKLKLKTSQWQDNYGATLNMSKTMKTFTVIIFHWSRCSTYICTWGCNTLNKYLLARIPENKNCCMEVDYESPHLQQWDIHVMLLVLCESALSHLRAYNSSPPLSLSSRCAPSHLRSGPPLFVVRVRTTYTHVFF